MATQLHNILVFYLLIFAVLVVRVHRVVHRPSFKRICLLHLHLLFFSIVGRN